MRFFLKNNIKGKGFTLIELIVVLAIIAILVAIVTINVTDTRNKAKNSAIISNLNSLRPAGGLWNDTHGSYAAFCVNNCNAGSDDWQNICAAVRLQNGGTVPTCNARDADWCVSSPLVDGGNYCVDSINKTGNSDCGLGFSCP